MNKNILLFVLFFGFGSFAMGSSDGEGRAAVVNPGEGGISNGDHQELMTIQSEEQRLADGQNGNGIQRDTRTAVGGQKTQPAGSKGGVHFTAPEDEKIKARVTDLETNLTEIKSKLNSLKSFYKLSNDDATRSFSQSRQGYFRLDPEKRTVTIFNKLEGRYFTMTLDEQDFNKLKSDLEKTHKNFSYFVSHESTIYSIDINKRPDLYGGDTSLSILNRFVLDKINQLKEPLINTLVRVELLKQGFNDEEISRMLNNREFSGALTNFYQYIENDLFDINTERFSRKAALNYHLKTLLTSIQKIQFSEDQHPEETKEKINQYIKRLESERSGLSQKAAQFLKEKVNEANRAEAIGQFKNGFKCVLMLAIVFGGIFGLITGINQ